MALLQCSKCGTDNPTDARFCQKCGNALFVVCKRCGTENAHGVKFCKSCGTELVKAKFALSEDAVKRWRRVLGGISGWSPAFTPDVKCLETWAKLSPPLDPSQEPFIFDVKITGRTIGARGKFKVFGVTIEGETIIYHNSFSGPKWAYLLATDSRLVVYIREDRYAKQVLYEQIVALNVQNDHFILVLRDGSQIDLHMYIEHPGLLGAMAVMGAPPAAKPQALSHAMSEVRDADNFIAAFSEFFMEIIEENKRRQK